jgi:DNA-binding MarR family transcriptional regulator
VRSITVTIHWHDEEQEQATEITLQKGGVWTSLQRETSRKLLSRNKKTSSQISVGKPKSQLLPSDRVILDALLKRALHGDRITVPVRNGDLAAECEISRRQVQICLKRLIEKGLIKRLMEGADAGSNSGYRYLML